MKADITLVKGNNGDVVLYPATHYDLELLNNYKAGDPVKAKLKKQSPRSLQHHKLYFGGLLELAMQYWNPQGGMISACEKQTLKGLVDYVERHDYDSSAVKELCRSFLMNLKAERAESIQAPHRDKQGLHDWVKEEAGYYDWVKTPEGLVKRVHSISFDSMSQEDFNLFYKRAFAVIWNFLLSRSFKNEQEAHNIINQLSGMG